MARKLKTYQTSIGFFDLVIAAPSMKAALEAWGANSNLFHQGFAHEVDDEDVVSAALDKPGVILKRPVGTEGPFSEHPDLPADPPLSKAKAKAEKTPAKQPEAKPKEAKPTKKPDDKAARKAALAFEREQEKRESERRKAEVAEAKLRARREQAVEKAQAALDEAEGEHDGAVRALEDERRALEAKLEKENVRWDQQKQRLKAALERARSSE